MSESVDRIAIRRALKTVIDDADGIEWSTVINETAAQEDVPADAVRAILVDMEREGFVYRIGDGDDAEVKVT